MLRAGRIAYTNDLPIYYGFDAGVLRFPGALVADVPASLNALLIGGQLDLSPISAAFYAQHASDVALLPELCIGSRDQVWSVTLISPVPPAALGGRGIAVTTESASGRMLLDVLLRRRYGVVATFRDDLDAGAAAKAGEPSLLIGDAALEAQRSALPENVYDLGSLWHDWTGEDMVYAVWGVRRDVLAAHEPLVVEALEALIAARSWGLAHLEAVIDAAQIARPRTQGFYAAYYRTLNFMFDERARRGLARFIDESVAAGLLPRRCSSEPEALRVAR